MEEDFTEDKFSKLCSQFQDACDDKVMAMLDEDDILDTTPKTPGLPSKAHVSMKLMKQLAKAFLIKLPYYTVAEKLPGKAGEYFKDKANNDRAMDLNLIFAEHSAGLQLANGIHPMRITDKMPKELISPQALEIAERHKMPCMAHLIQYGMK